jgi:hypothetical protein
MSISSPTDQSPPLVAPSSFHDDIDRLPSLPIFQTWNLGNMRRDVDFNEFVEVMRDDRSNHFKYAYLIDRYGASALVSMGQKER